MICFAPAPRKEIEMDTFLNEATNEQLLVSKNMYLNIVVKRTSRKVRKIHSLVTEQ